MTYKMSHPDEWTLARKLMAVELTADMSNQQLSIWCREQGIYIDHLVSWNLAFSKVEDTGSNVIKAVLRDLRRALAESPEDFFSLRTPTDNPRG